MASMANPRYPELRKERGGDVIEAAVHLIEEEMGIAERLDRKAGEQWQFVALAAPLAISGALTAASVKGLASPWIIVLVIGSFVTLVLLVVAMLAGSKMADVKSVEGLDPDRLDDYLNELSNYGEPAEPRIRAALAHDLVDVARSREEANEKRLRQLKDVIRKARFTFFAAISVLALAAFAVMVNA